MSEPAKQPENPNRAKAGQWSQFPKWVVRSGAWRGLGSAAQVYGAILARDERPDHVVIVRMSDPAPKPGEPPEPPNSLAHDTGLCERQVRRAIAVLMGSGLITRMHRGCKDGGASEYRINMTKPDTGVLLDEISNRAPMAGMTEQTGQIATANRTNSATKPDTGVLPNRQDTQDRLQKEKKRAAVAALPFDSDAFKAAWANWMQHRTESRNKLTPTAARQQLAKLASMGEARAIAAIEHSLANGWQGIYEPKEHHHANHNPDDRRNARATREWSEPVTALPRE